MYCDYDKENLQVNKGVKRNISNDAEFSMEIVKKAIKNSDITNTTLNYFNKQIKKDEIALENKEKSVQEAFLGSTLLGYPNEAESALKQANGITSESFKFIKKIDGKIKDIMKFKTKKHLNFNEVKNKDLEMFISFRRSLLNNDVIHSHNTNKIENNCANSRCISPSMQFSELEKSESITNYSRKVKLLCICCAEFPKITELECCLQKYEISVEQFDYKPSVQINPRFVYEDIALNSYSGLIVYSEGKLLTTTTTDLLKRIIGLSLKLSWLGVVIIRDSCTSEFHHFLAKLQISIIRLSTDTCKNQILLANSYEQLAQWICLLKSEDSIYSNPHFRDAFIRVFSLLTVQLPYYEKHNKADIQQKFPYFNIFAASDLAWTAEDFEKLCTVDIKNINFILPKMKWQILEV